jgi:hypothetical protein
LNDICKQRDELHAHLTSLQLEHERIQQENKALKEEVFVFSFLFHLLFSYYFEKIKSKDEINRDLKLALTSSNNDTQTIYNQLRQLNTSLSDLQQKYDRDIAERNHQIEIYHTEQKQMIVI